MEWGGSLSNWLEMDSTSWVIYGLYSGSIYVCGGFATAGDYYYLMFVTAYVVYMRKTAKNA